MTKTLGIYGPETDRIKGKLNTLKNLFGPQYTIRFVNSNLSIPSQIESLKDLSALIAMPSIFPNELVEKCKNLKLIQVCNFLTHPPQAGVKVVIIIIG